jgi:hypothetical protein
VCDVCVLHYAIDEMMCIPLQWLPLRVGTYKCAIVLLDENVGEFMHEVVGESTNPVPLPGDCVKWSIPDKGECSLCASCSSLSFCLDLWL